MNSLWDFQLGGNNFTLFAIKIVLNLWNVEENEANYYTKKRFYDKIKGNEPHVASN